MLAAFEGKNLNTRTYRGCSRMRKQEFAYKSLSDMGVGCFGKDWFGNGVPKLQRLLEHKIWENYQFLICQLLELRTCISVCSCPVLQLCAASGGVIVVNSLEQRSWKYLEKRHKSPTERQSARFLVATRVLRSPS